MLLNIIVQTVALFDVLIYVEILMDELEFVNEFEFEESLMYQ